MGGWVDGCVVDDGWMDRQTIITRGAHISIPHVNNKWFGLIS